jgi:16S rRNA C967 or C1407 C5-methylase (RsmB/RsmF family)/NOL1/NOP2/fmu family ribosome biogenesis protein
VNTLPKEFVESILSLFPEEAGYFFEALSNNAITSIRLNAHKKSTAFENEIPIEWCANGRYLAERPSFISDPLLHAGAYYVQESSSMFLDACIKCLPLPENAIALDLCAAPGGKSTLILDALPKDSMLVSNEIIKSRVNVLQENLTRWGSPNCVVTNNDPKIFQKAGAIFDLIVVDAPCSGEGLWRRDANAINEWSMPNVLLCEARQERILQDILPCLKPGGFLIYSTCTFNEIENEKQVEKLVLDQTVKPYPINIPADWPCKSNDHFQFRFLPHLVKGEGLFMAVLQKPYVQDDSNKHQKRAGLNFVSKKLLPELHTWLANPLTFDYFMENDFAYAFPKSVLAVYEIIRSSLYVKHAGICMGKFDKNGKLIPEHSLAMSTALAKQIPKFGLNRDEAISYLQKGNIHPPNNGLNGWCLAHYYGLALGWLKVLPNRVNNYFPPEYRILKDIQIG